MGNNSGMGPGEAIVIVLYLAVAVIIIAGMWKMFEKANQPGWGVLIPFYNMVLLLRVAGKPIWWLILMFVPLVNFVIAILMAAGIARNFGKGVGFTVGLIFLPYIFYPILGFGKAEYMPAGLPVMDQGTQRVAAMRA